MITNHSKYFLFQVEYHKNLTETYMKKFQENSYKFVKYINYDEDITEGEARQQAM